MIFKCITFFTRLGIGISLGLIAFVLVILAMADATKAYVEDAKMPYNDMSYIVRAHQITEQGEIGTVHMCSICRKNFTKTSMNVNCCSAEHEREYQEMYKAWTSGNKDKEVVESYGKVFK